MKTKYDGQVYDFLTQEELLTKKKRGYTWADEHLVNNLCNICLQKVGRDFIWGKKHDYEDLHLIDVVALTGQQREELEPIIINIIRKQLGFSKKEAEREAGWFWFGIGLSTYYPKGTEPDNEKDRKLYLTEAEYKKFLRDRIKKYEEKNGELKYEDGWESELKEFCGYKK